MAVAAPERTEKSAPGPKGLPLIGNAHQFAGNVVLNRYMAMRKEYGDIVQLKFGPMDAFVLYSPEYVHHVLVKNQKNYIKGIGYDGFRLLVGNGLVTSDGETWRTHRRLLQPPFTPTAVMQFHQMMVDVTNGLLDRWQAVADAGGSIVMDEEMMRLTMSIIGRAMFDIDLDKEIKEVGQALHEAFAFIPQRSNALIPMSVPLPSHTRFKRNLEVINTFIYERIAEARKNGPSNTLLSRLIQARDEETGEALDDLALRDEAVTLFFAGFETTARSLTWVWYLITRHPEVQQRLVAEATAVLGAGANRHDPSVEDLHKLVYTHQVVDETLRIYPPTSLLARQASGDDVIGGYDIKAGSMIILVPHLVHRTESVWPDPERFDPDRFLPEADAARPKSAYIPFASGPRVCLGNSFALLEMVLALSMASARYVIEAESQDEVPYEFAGTVRPARPIRMRLAPR
jgi:cytochrome P450